MNKEPGSIGRVSNGFGLGGTDLSNSDIKDVVFDFRLHSNFIYSNNKIEYFHQDGSLSTSTIRQEIEGGKFAIITEGGNNNGFVAAIDKDNIYLYHTFINIYVEFAHNLEEGSDSEVRLIFGFDLSSSTERDSMYYYYSNNDETTNTVRHEGNTDADAWVAGGQNIYTGGYIGNIPNSGNVNGIDNNFDRNNHIYPSAESTIHGNEDLALDFYVFENNTYYNASGELVTVGDSLSVENVIGSLITPIPEPSTYAFVIGGISLMVVVIIRKKKFSL